MKPGEGGGEPTTPTPPLSPGSRGSGLGRLPISPLQTALIPHWN